MAAVALVHVEAAVPSPPERRGWFDKLRSGLKKTGSSIAQVFTGTQIDDALYEELESALLMADAGVKATEFLLADLKRRVKEAKAADPAAVKALLADAIADLLMPLQQGLRVGEQTPTVIMVVGVNGAGKTTSIGKLTRHLAESKQKVLLAAADTFRAAAREQLAVWAGRNSVEIVSQEGGDPAAVTFDAVTAGKARGCDVVIADTAGRLTTQAHLMEELKKIRRVIGKAMEGAPHEVLLVVDGNTGQNALSQVQLLRRGARPHRAHHHQARRHCEGRGARGGRACGRAGGRSRCRSTSSALARSSKTCRPSTRASSRRRCSPDDDQSFFFGGLDSGVGPELNSSNQVEGGGSMASITSSDEGSRSGSSNGLGAAGGAGGAA